MTPADSYYPNETIESMSHYIVMESRLPNAITALLAGAALATSGLLLQTAFRNPLAGPDVFGISSGAALAVAVVMLASAAISLSQASASAASCHWTDSPSVAS